MADVSGKRCFKALVKTKDNATKVFKKDDYSIDIEWKIDNFLSQPSAVGDMLSVDWDIPEKNLKFDIRMYPGGDDINNTRYVSFFIRNKSNRDVAYASQKWCIMKDSKEIISDETKKHELLKNGRTWGWPSLVKRSEIEGNPEKYLQDGALILLVHNNIIEPAIIEEGNEVAAKDVEKESNEVANVAKDLKDFFMEGLTNTDVTLTCDEGEVKCHKLMLTSRSKVFRGYFKEGNDSLENKTNTVKIDDASLESIQEMAKFIYTDEFNKDYENIGQLLHLAQKYNIQGLKVKSEDFLCSKITAETAAELAGLGKTYLANKLKDKSIDFITKNMQKVTEADGWSDLIKSHPEIITEIVLKMRPLADD